MQVFRTLGAVPAGFGPSVVAIGNFDGVHCGHRAILAEVCERARAARAHSVVVTFDPHPLQVLRPEQAPLLLSTPDQRLELLAAAGVQATLVIPFTPELSRQSADTFATSVLQQALHATAVHEGDNFRFGYRAEAGVETLRALGEALGFSVVTHPVLTKRGLLVSSSQVRSLVAGGQVEPARALLGRPYAIRSTPARGRGIGTRLLVPTVNLAPTDEIKPAHGVYVTRLRVGEGADARIFQAITNAGNRPTFGEDSYAVESHLLDFEPVELTESTPLELQFLHRLRGERRFPSPEALKQQIGLDIAKARRYHRLAEHLVPALR